MTERGARARTLNSEDFDFGTAESIVRQRALRAAVLIDAIRCLVGAARVRERPVRQPALRWILSHDVKAPFSFNNVCEALGLDPSRLRRSLLGPSFGADGVPQIALGGERRGGTSGYLGIRRPQRDRSRYIVLDGAS
jgi:hypothetical protein